ncbi:MAG: DUF6340 family protein [Lentimicrobiaceae bacterium]|nr:DUF6340 family protein [Lentimicrobiaceae bacterium]
MRLIFGHFRWISYGFFVLLTSCVSMGKISIQVSVPPEKPISNEIQSVVLMNRSMNSSFSNLNQDSLENLFIKKKLVLDEPMLDSLAADTTLKSLGNALYESGRFDVVIPVQRNLPNTNLSYATKSPSLSLAQVKQICTEFKTDALLSLENFYENVNTSYHVGFERITDYGSLKQYNIIVQVAYHSNWKLYQPAEKLKIASFEVNDTIFWEKNGNSLQETYEELPTIKDALLSGAIENGQTLSGYISPGWQEQSRNYFITNNAEADRAIAYVKSNYWKDAERIWMKFSTSSSPALRSMIEYNLALAAEMNGDLKAAIQWAKRSFKSKFSRTAEEYINLLNRLQNEKPLLN